MASGKVRVAILGTVGKAVFIDPNANRGATIGTDLRLPDGSVPSLRRLAEIICSYCDPVEPAPIIWKYVYEIPDNLGQIANLDCCGIIVRRCGLDPSTEFDDSLVVEKIGDLPSLENSNGYTAGSIAWRDNTLLMQTWHYATPSAPTFFSGSIKRLTRLVNPDGGWDGPLEEQLIPLASGVYRVASVRLSSTHQTHQRQQAGTGSGVTRWYTQGVPGNTIKCYFADDWYHSVRGLRSMTWVPGQGIYAIQRGHTTSQTAIAFYPAPLPESEPPELAAAGVIVLEDVAYNNNGGQIKSYDREGNIYWVNSNRLKVYNPALQLLNDAPLPGVLPETGGQTANWVQSIVFADGKYIGVSPAVVSGGNSAQLHVYNIADGAIEYAGSFPAPIDLTNNVEPYDLCDFVSLSNEEQWTVCPGEVEVPGTGVAWGCLELQAAGGGQSRITIENPAGQAGDPIFDLREVTQAEGGTPQAFTVDAWGRVSESRPLVAGDIPELGYEPALGDPDSDGHVLHSQADGTRYWSAPALVGGVDFDGGSSETVYNSLARYGDEGDSLEKYSVNATEFDEGAAG